MGKAKAGSRKKMKITVLSRLLALIAVVLLLYLAATLFFQVKVVEIRGLTRYGEEELRRAAGLQTGDKLLNVNLKKNMIGSQLARQYAYIDTIRVQIRLPDTVIIEIEECEPAAYIKSGNSLWIVDKQGKILEKTSSLFTAGLPEVRGLTLEEPAVNREFDGVAGDETKKTSFLELISALENSGLMGQIDYIDLTTIADLAFGYLGRFHVRIGLMTDLEYKLDCLRTVYERSFAAQPGLKGMVDLSSCTEESTNRSVHFVEDIG